MCLGVCEREVPPREEDASFILYKEALTNGDFSPDRFDKTMSAFFCKRDKTPCSSQDALLESGKSEAKLRSLSKLS